MARSRHKHSGPKHLSRREFLGGVAGAAALGHSAWSHGLAYAQTPLPPPEQSGVDHVIWVMMENRSFDHYFIRLTAKDQFGNVISTADDIEVIVH